MKRILFSLLVLFVMLSALACDGAEGVTTLPQGDATVTLWDGFYESAFASNANITATVDGASFKIYNRHPTPIHITRIDLHLN